MKTLHVLDTSAPRGAGYTRRACALLEAQLALGLEPAAVTGVRHIGGSTDSEEIGGVLYHRTTRVPAGRLAGIPAIREALEMAALARRIHEVVRGSDVEVIHAHSPVLCGVPAHAVATRIGAASVYEICALWEDAASVAPESRGRHGPRRGRSLARAAARYATVRAAETMLARSVDALVVIGEGLRRDLIARGLDPQRIFTVPNGVDTERFQPATRDEALTARLGFQDKTVVAFVGSLFRFEGAALLLEALTKVVAQDDSVRGLVVGGGPFEEELRRLRGDLGLADKVAITGALPDDEVLRHYAVADVVCYPRERHRLTELTTPLAPLEAMCMEKAVIGADVGGILELLRDGETGLCFRAGDADDLARAIRTLVADEPLRRRLGAAARQDMRCNREWSRLATRYVDVYAAAKERQRWRLKRGLGAVSRARMPVYDPPSERPAVAYISAERSVLPVL